jgi:predicted metalloprotease with PDZ domain
MKMSQRCFKIVFLVLLCFSSSRAEKLLYVLDVDSELFKAFEIRIDILDNTQKRLVVSMPVWTPGSYLVENYGDHVYNVQAESGSGEKLKIEKLSRNDWEIQTEKQPHVVLRYEVEVTPSGYWGPSLDSASAQVQGASTWMYIRNLQQLPMFVRINPYRNWCVGTGLERSDGKNLFIADNYDELVDCPILMGDLVDTLFTVQNKPHEIFIRGDAEYRLADLVRQVEKIVRFQVDFFGYIPYDRYVFLYTFLPDFKSGGGLEHANSTSIAISATEVSKDINSIANITAHEFFHLWNVKRITSESLKPLTYNRIRRTESLWWLEGVTSYYADITLVRTGIWTVDEFLQNIEKEIEMLQQNPDRLKTSLADASWNICENGYSGFGISYYNKGLLVGLLLDIMIRKVTDNRHSLDTVCQVLRDNYALQNKAFADGDIQKIVERISGKDFGAFFDRYETGTVELPYAEILKLAGIGVRIENKDEPWIGVVRLLGSRNRVFSIDADGPAGRAGLRRNDFLLAVDDVAVTDREDFARKIGQKQIGSTVKLTVERDKTKQDFFVVVETFRSIDCTLEMMDDVTSEQLSMRNSLLGIKEKAVKDNEK